MLSRSFLTTAGVACVVPLLLAQTAIRQPVLEKVITGLQYAEGPVWLPHGGLLLSDTPQQRLLRWNGSGLPTIVRRDVAGPYGNAVDAQGRIYTCEWRARRLVRTTGANPPEVLAERFEGHRLNSPNDVVVRRDGHIYFTDPAFGSAADSRELAFNGVYHLTPKGALEAIARPITRPNGIALSPDGKRLYVSNSDEQNLRVYDLDHQGNPSHERVLVTGIAGTPGGVKVDQHRIYLTAGNLLIYRLDGQPEEHFEFSEPTTNVALGDTPSTLYVTTRTAVYRLRFQGAQDQ